MPAVKVNFPDTGQLLPLPLSLLVSMSLCRNLQGKDVQHLLGKLSPRCPHDSAQMAPQESSLLVLPISFI